MSKEAGFEQELMGLLEGIQEKREVGYNESEIHQSFIDSLSELMMEKGSNEELVQILKGNTSEGGLIDPRQEGDINIWLWCYQVLANDGDFRAADDLIEQCYDCLLTLQKDNDRRYHKGAPLQQRGTGWAQLDFTKAKRFILLAYIEDIISEQKEAPAYQSLKNVGVTDEDLETVEKETARILENRGELRFPEEVYQNVKSEIEVKSLGEFERDIVFTNTEYLTTLLERVEEASQSGDEDDKRRTLEDLAQYLFSSVEGFEFESQKTDFYQLDGIITNTSHHTFLQTLDNFILVECKNWKGPIGLPVVNEFLGKLDIYQCGTGILLSRGGVKKQTTVEPRRDAYRRANKAILVLDKNDIESIIDGEANIVSLLVEEFKRLKFAV